MIFGFCVEKGSELPQGHSQRKFKGRVVFRGNQVRDEDHYLATLQDMGSAPASMASGKFSDFLGLLPGWRLMQADAVRAYTQALLRGTTTWIRLLHDQWPKHWHGMKDPVCRLRLALYGHPDAGTCWEKHCEERLATAGLRPVPNWSGCFVHQSLHAFLTVYVDDFKLACAERHADAVWKAIKAQLQLEPPTPLDRYLGCAHIENGGCLKDPTKTPGKTLPRLSECFRGDNSLPSKHRVRTLRYDMVSFVDQCVEAYTTLAGPNAKPLQKVATPFLDKHGVGPARRGTHRHLEERGVEDPYEDPVRGKNGSTGHTPGHLHAG